LLSGLLVAAIAAGCTAGTNAPATGAAGSGGSGSGAAGATGGAGSGGGGRGGSGPAGTTGFGGINVGGTGGGNCGLQSFDLERKPAEILLLLDRSASMQDPPDVTPAVSTPKWDLIIPAVKQVIMDSDASVHWGLKVFPEGEGSECVAGSVTSKIDVPIAPMNATAVINAINATTDEGNGTPTGDAVNAAVAYLRTLTSDNKKYILLATDGEPSCAGTSEGQTAARPYAVTAVTNAATANFHTFVVGVATTKDSATAVLNDLAVAGKEPRAGLLTRYYLGTTQSDLSAALAFITGQASSCIFPLNPPPPVKNDPAKLGVYFTSANTKIPHDPAAANGWSYLNAENTSLQVYGPWCDMIKSAGADKVQIIYGCPLIDVP
jgi:hypothetical protein